LLVIHNHLKKGNGVGTFKRKHSALAQFKMY